MRKQQLKMGGVIALLASTLAFSPSAFALNTTIGNGDRSSVGSFLGIGQSFINDPSGTGATINLNTWTFSFVTPRSEALGSTLTIYSGTGSGGLVVGTSINTSLSADPRDVTWTFTGGLSIIDTQTYSAFTQPNVFRIQVTTGSRLYPNGSATDAINAITDSDLVFEGTFSAVTPVPFEFSPALGLGVLGGLFALKKFVKKKKAS